MDFPEKYRKAGADQITEEKLAKFYKKYGFLNGFLVECNLKGKENLKAFRKSLEVRNGLQRDLRIMVKQSLFR